MDTQSPVALFLTSSVIGGVISGAISQIAPWLRERAVKRDAADFSALRLALMLEEFAGECSSNYSETQTCIGSNGAAGELQGRLPPLPDYPADIAWQALGTKITTWVLHFRVERSNLADDISGHWQFSAEDREDQARYVGEKALELGWKAVALSEAIRKARKLEPAYPTGEWRTKTYIAESLDEEEQRRQRIAARIAARDAAKKIDDDI